MQCKLDPERLSPRSAMRTLDRTIVSSPLGDIVVVFEGDAVAGLYFVDEQKYVPPVVARLPIADERPIVKAARGQLARYFGAGVDLHIGPDVYVGALAVAANTANDPDSPPSFDLRLYLRGTPFQLRVWEALLTIPSGQTRTYGGIAESIGSMNAMRAVGAAIGRNPISIVVPCHRVIGANGSLTGFAGGVDRKARLLEIEGSRMQASLDFHIR